MFKLTENLISLDVQVFSVFKPQKLARNLTKAVVLWNHAVSARYRKNGVGSNRPKSLPLMCLDEGAKGNRVFTVLASSSNRSAGLSAASICRMQSKYAGFRSGHAGRSALRTLAFLSRLSSLRQATIAGSGR